MKLSRCRLLINGIGCALWVVFCLPMAFWLAIGLGQRVPPLAHDPDAGKALGVYWVGIVGCGALGVAALFSLMRTIRRWRSNA